MYRNPFLSPYEAANNRYSEAALTEAARVVADFPTALSTAEADAVTTFVASLYDSGDWAELYECHLFALTAPTNALHGLKLGTTASSTSAPTHTPGTGYTFTTAQWLNLGYAIPYADRGFRFGCYNSSLTQPGANAVLMGTYDGGNFGASYMRYKSSTNQWESYFCFHAFTASPIQQRGAAKAWENELIDLGSESGATPTDNTFTVGDFRYTESDADAVVMPTTNMYVNTTNGGTTAGLARTTQFAYMGSENLSYATLRRALFRLLRALGIANVGQTQVLVWGDSNVGLQAKHTVILSDRFPAQFLAGGTAASGKRMTDTVLPEPSGSTMEEEIIAWAATLNQPTANAILVIGGGNDANEGQNVDPTDPDEHVTKTDMETTLDNMIAACASRGIRLYVGENTGVRRAYPVPYYYYGGLSSVQEDGLEARLNSYYEAASERAANGELTLVPIRSVMCDPTLGEGYDYVKLEYLEPVSVSNPDYLHYNNAGMTALGDSIRQLFYREAGATDIDP